MKESPPKLKNVLTMSAGTIVLIALLSYGGYRSWELRERNFFLGAWTAELEKEVSALEHDVASLRSDLASKVQENSDLATNLQAEQNRNNAFESQINGISGTVGILKKLSEIDPELLKKYSKVYFLNENYAPANLSSIGSQYLYDKNRPQLMHAGVLPRLEAMLETAKRDGITLQVVSAYRSFYEQTYVKIGYKITYGAGTANQFSADQGYSEHQLGTAVDFTTPEVKEVFSNFEKSTAYAWLNANAYKFGFVLSYPKNNTYYQFEPWHWRFVGTALATKLHEANKYFYNLSQSEIDQYLVSFFD